MAHRTNFAQKNHREDLQGWPRWENPGAFPKAGPIFQHPFLFPNENAGVWRRGEIGKGWGCNTWPQRPHSKHVWNIPSRNLLQTNYCTRNSRKNKAIVLWPLRALRRMNYCTNYCDSKELLQRHPLRNPPLFRTPKSGKNFPAASIRSRPGKPNQKKGQTEKFMNFTHFCEFWCFSLGKQARFTLNFCSGMPLRKVHELTFFWFGLPGPLLNQSLLETPFLQWISESHSLLESSELMVCNPFATAGNTLAILQDFRCGWDVARMWLRSGSEVALDLTCFWMW